MVLIRATRGDQNVATKYMLAGFGVPLLMLISAETLILIMCRTRVKVKVPEPDPLMLGDRMPIQSGLNSGSPSVVTECVQAVSWWVF